MEPITIRWKKLDPQAEIPTYGSPGAACFDFRALLKSDLEIRPGEIAAIPTGLACEVPPGFELQVRARSGLAFKHGLSLPNGIGTVDSDYRGEVKVLVILLGKEPLVIRNGDRVAQGLVARVQPLRFEEVDELGSTERGSGGFGSTGRR
jgi:dUTP pyrophosphatase